MFKATQKRSIQAILALAATAALTQSASAAVATWDYGATPNTAWSNNTNWSNNSLGVVTGDDVVFNATGTGTTTLMDKTSPFVINSLTINSTNSATPFSHTIDLNAGTLNTTAVALATGGSGNNSIYYGNLNVQNGTLGISGSLRIGEKTGTTTGSQSHGLLAGGAGSTVIATGLSSFIVGYQGHSSGSSSGSVSLGAGQLGIGAGATFRVGYSTANAGTTGTVTLGSTFTSTTIGTGTGALDRTAVQIGYKTTDNGSPTGSFTQNGGSFTAYASTLDVGYSSNASTGNYATGTLDLHSVSSVAIDVDTLRIGVGSPRSSGTMKLAPGNVTVNSAATVGSGLSGLLELNKTNFSVGNAATLNLGNIGEINSTIGAVSAGIDIANSAPAALVISNSAQVSNSRGLEITFEANPTGVNWATFSSGPTPTDIFYGFKWAGNQVTNLTGILDGGDSTVGTSDDTIVYTQAALTGQFAGKANIFYDGTGAGTLGTNATYIGFYTSVVPEPSMTGLAGLAGLAMMVRRRHR